MKFKMLIEKISKVSPKHPGCGCGIGINHGIGII